MMDYCVKPLSAKEFTVEAPASKSILNRALVLSSFTEGETMLLCGNYGEDTRALLSCLHALGVGVEHTPQGLLVHGTRNVTRKAAIDVRDSGTSARFLTAVLAFLGGDFTLNASKQMCGRPMELTALLEKCGVSFEFFGEKGRLPFRMHGAGIEESALACDTDISTQYASGIMLAAAVGNKPFRLALTGGGATSSYLAMTAALIRAFGGACERNGNLFEIVPIARKPQTFSVEPDVSAACYFYALALLCRAKVTVRGITRESLQGDIRFLDLLERRGVEIVRSAEGLTADGTNVESYRGFKEDIGDFADQAPTIAALAPFATTPTRLTGLGRSRYKESDRLHSICKNLYMLGVDCRADEDRLTVWPRLPHAGCIDPCGDHRIAMAFTLIGLKTGGITISEPDCCNKTFEEFFPIVNGLTTR